MATGVTQSVVFQAILEHYSLTEENCAQPVSDAHLIDISQSHCEHWRELPAKLGLKTIVAKDIDRDQRHETEKRVAFFEKWRQERGSDATYKCLILALLGIKCRMDAESVCKILAMSLIPAASKEGESRQREAKATWQLFVHDLEDKSLAVTIKSENPERITVKELKQQIEKMTGTNHKEQILTCHKTRLKDNYTLEQSSVTNQSHLFLITQKERESYCAFCSVSRSADGASLFSICEHTICRSCLFGLICYYQKNTCPVCSTEWSIQAIKEHGDVSDTDIQKLEKALQSILLNSSPP